VPVWVLPGGGVEEKEDPTSAIIREILEETGLTVKVDRLIATYYPMNKLAKITQSYECVVIGGGLKTSSETKNVTFYSLDTLPPLMPPPYREWIEDAKIKREPIERILTTVTYKRLLKEALSHPILALRFLLARIGLACNS
jgi:8-oxo-dGTP diphosphatase